MKFIGACLAVFLSLRVASAGEPLPEGQIFQPAHFEIIWAAPTNSQPTTLWIYRNIPQNFSTGMISNLMALGSFTMRDRRKLPEEDLAKDKDGLAFVNKEETRYLGISPAFGFIEYRDDKANDVMKPVEGVPSEAKVKKLALELLDKMGIPRFDFATKSAKKNDVLAFGDKETRGHFDQKKKKFVNEVDKRGIFFIRKVEGVNFAGIGVAGGFHVEFASHAQIAQLEIVWRNLQPFQQYEIASSKQIIDRVKEGKAVLPYPLANPDLNPSEIKKLTVKDFSPLYKGALGDEQQEFTFPFAKLDCIADTGKSNLNIQLYCPILSTNTIGK